MLAEGHAGISSVLNELYGLERGLVAAGFEVAQRHADVSSPGHTTALHLRLDEAGMSSEVMALEKDRVASLWTLRNGKHNSFPYMQLKSPLLGVPDEADWRKADGDAWRALTPGGRRRHLHNLAREHGVSHKACNILTSGGLRDSLRARQKALASLQAPHDAVPAVIERVLAIGNLAGFADRLLTLSLAGLEEGDDALLDAVRVLLVGRLVQGQVTGSPVFVDVIEGEFARDVADPSHAAAISRALSSETAGESERGTCFLSGKEVVLHAGAFPQPTVPVLGQIYMFSKNADIPAAHRYGHADNVGLPVGSALSQSLSGALVAITVPSLKGKTWRSIPGEKAKATDLLMVFVDRVPEAPVAEFLAADEAEDDGSGEETGHLSEAERQAAIAGSARGAFRVRAERVVEAVKGKAGVDFWERSVAVLVLRKVDTGNAKAILHRTLTVGGLHDAAAAWVKALENVPDWLRMPVPRKGKPPRQSGVPSIAPLQLPRLTRAVFIRGGTERAKREPVGITAADALTLFLDETGSRQIAVAALRTLLTRQGGLLARTAQALRRPDPKAAQELDRGSALQAAGLIGVLLAKMGNSREGYMHNAGFQLGQILAAADVIHVGYCADMRGGQVPPTLLGNSMLAIAHDDPQRALAMLCLRWKPYLAWVKGQADWSEAKRLSASKNPNESTKGWAIMTALSQASRVKEVATSLASHLPDFAGGGDAFRAELLLGYVAGLPKADRDDKTEI